MKPDPVKQKIQELCPDVVTPHNCDCSMHESLGFSVEHQIIGSSITIAVVLRAIGKEHGVADIYLQHNAHVCIQVFGIEGNCFWNLEHDNYDRQSEETRAFIGSLLGVN